MLKRKFIKTIEILMLILLFSSCVSQNGRGNTQIKNEDAMDAIDMLYSDSIDLAINNFSLSDEDVRPLFPQTLFDYEELFSRFQSLYDDAKDDLIALLEGAAKYALSDLYDFPYNTYDPVQMLREANLFSENRLRLLNELERDARLYISLKGAEFISSYNALKFECDIIKKNQDNLETVGFSSSLENIGDLDFNAASLFVAERSYMELYQSELRLRNLPLSLHDDSRYALFWEAL